jgi:hypothetical protein
MQTWSSNVNCNVISKGYKLSFVIEMEDEDTDMLQERNGNNEDGDSGNDGNDGKGKGGDDSDGNLT